MDHSKLFASSTLFWSLPIEEWFKLAKEQGLKGLELWIQQLEYKGIEPEEIRNLSQKYDLKLTLHSYSWDCNLLATPVFMRKAAVQLTKEALALGGYIEAGSVTIHPGSIRDILPQQEYFKLLADAIGYLGNYAREQGTVASLEIMEKIKGEYLTTVQAAVNLESIYGEEKTWQYTEDIAHCDTEEEIYNLREVLGNSLSEFHLSNKKNQCRHVADVEKGDFDLPTVVDKLANSDKPFIMEGLDTSTDAAFFKRFLRYLDR